MNDSSRWTTLSLANVHTTNTISFVPNAVIHFWPPASIAKMLRAQVASPLKVMANLRTTMSVSRCIKDTRIARSATSGFGLRNARSARASFATACKLWKHLAGNITGSASVVLYVSSTLASWRSSLYSAHLFLGIQGCDKPFDNPSFFLRDNKTFCERCYSIILKSEM